MRHHGRCWGWWWGRRRCLRSPPADTRECGGLVQRGEQFRAVVPRTKVTEVDVNAVAGVLKRGLSAAMLQATQVTPMGPGMEVATVLVEKSP